MRQDIILQPLFVKSSLPSDFMLSSQVLHNVVVIISIGVCRYEWMRVYAYWIDTRSARVGDDEAVWQRNLVIYEYEICDASYQDYVDVWFDYTRWNYNV